MKRGRGEWNGWIWDEGIPQWESNIIVECKICRNLFRINTDEIAEDSPFLCPDCLHCKGCKQLDTKGNIAKCKMEPESPIKHCVLKCKNKDPKWEMRWKME